MRKTAYISGLIKAATSNMQKHAAWWNPVDWGKALGNWAYDVTNGDVDFQLKTYDYDKIPQSIKDRAAGAANMSAWQAAKMLRNAERIAWENSIYNQERQDQYVNKVRQLSKITDDDEYARKMLQLQKQYAPSTFRYQSADQIQRRYAKRNPFAAYARATGKVPGQVEDYPWWVDTLGFILGGDKDDALGQTAYATTLARIPTELTRNQAAIDKLHAVRNGLYRIQQQAPEAAVQGLNVPTTGDVNWHNLAQWVNNPISEQLPQVSNQQIQNAANAYIHYNNKALQYMRQGADALSQSGMSAPRAAIENYPANYYKGLQGYVDMDIRSKQQQLNNIKADIRAGRRTQADAGQRIEYLTRKIDQYRRLTPQQKRYKNILAQSIPGSVVPGNEAVQNMAGWYMWYKDPQNARQRDQYIKNTVHPALTELASKLNITLPSW